MKGYKDTHTYKKAINARILGLPVVEKEVEVDDVKNNPTSMAEMYMVGKEKYLQAKKFGFSHLQSLLMAKK